MRSSNKYFKFEIMEHSLIVDIDNENDEAFYNWRSTNFFFRVSKTYSLVVQFNKCPRFFCFCMDIKDIVEVKSLRA